MKRVLLVSLLTVSFNLEAYDIHHPNPLSVLNGRSSHSRARTKPKTRQIKYKIAKKEKIKPKKRSRLQPGRMYRRHKEGKYTIKPEPFSISSEKSDPEILGPQRTYISENNAIKQQHEVNREEVTENTPVTMTKESCISLVGLDKFNIYIEKYKGEAGAIKRCLILKRMRG